MLSIFMPKAFEFCAVLAAWTKRDRNKKKMTQPSFELVGYLPSTMHMC